MSVTPRLPKAGKSHASRVNTYHAGERRPVSRTLYAVAGFWVRLLLGFGFVGCVSVAILFAYRSVTVEPFFAIRQVSISGNSYRDRRWLMTESNVRLGKNIFETSIRDIQHRLARDPWIAEVSVRRVLPDRVEIYTREKQACFWVKQDKTLYYADRQGKRIDKVRPEKFISLPLLSLVNSGPQQRMTLDQAVDLLDGKRLPFGFSSMASLTLTGENVLEILLDTPQMRVVIGVDDLSTNCSRLALAWNDLRRRDELNGVRSLQALRGKVWAHRG